MARHSLAHDLLRYRDNLLAFIVSLVRDWEVAEDIFQDVSIIILEKDAQGEAVRHFPAWSREIARRKVLEFWRKRKRVKPLSDEALRAVEEAFSRREGQSVFSGPLLERLRRCVERLPQTMRHLVRLRYLDNASHRDIGEQIGKSEGAVQVALSRVRSQLLDCTRKADAS